MHLMAAQWEFVRVCINLQTLLTTKEIYGLVKVRYWRAPTIWWKCVALENKWSGNMIVLNVEIGVSTSLQDVIPAQVRMSNQDNDNQDRMSYIIRTHMERNENPRAWYGHKKGKQRHPKVHRKL